MARQAREARRRGVSVRLTPRDQALIKAIARFRIARTSDLIRYAFPGVRRDTAAARLRRLFDTGYLTVRSESQWEENLYSLGPEGRRWFRAMGQEPGSMPRGSLDHHLAIVRTWIDLALELQRTEDLRLLSVRPDWELRKGVHPSRLVPDLLTVVLDEQEESRRYALAIEVDRGTEPLWVLKRKFERYEFEGLDGRALGQELGIGVVLTRGFEKRREGIAALLEQLWSGWYGLWTLAEGPGRIIRELADRMKAPLTGSPCGKGRDGRVSASGTTNRSVRGGGL